MRFLDPFYYIESRHEKRGGSGKGGGGGGDADAMIQYGQKGLDLQEKIYKENKADAQPWYSTGTSAVNQLSKLMGLNGTSANQNPASRQGLLDQYKGQFTTTSQGNQTALSPQDQGEYSRLMGIYKADPRNTDARNAANNILGKATPVSTSNTDMVGLNSYVDNLLAQQGAANESDPNFGKLAQNFSMDDFNTDPGYQFRLGEGQKALERKLNASGKTYSPEAAKALLGYNQDMGSQEYNNAYNRFNIDQDSLFNRLATLSGFGQTATGQIANAGTNYANAATEQYNGMGNAITSANLANKANNSSMFSSLLGAGAQLGGAYLMSDMRLKHDIQPYDEKDGYSRYKFRYNSMPEKEFIGVMAQDVLKIDPLAVEMMSDGYYAVDYGRLGFEMEEV